METPHASKPTVVILGAGVVGVCTALSLSSLPGQPVNVVLVDVLDEPFGAASGHNTGYITDTPVQPASINEDPPVDPINNLGSYSFKQWNALFADDPDLAERSSLRNGGPWLIERPGRGTPGTPRVESPASWIRMPPGHVAYRNVHNYASLNPKALGQCLVERCEAKGVKTHFGASVTQMELHADGSVAAIEFRLKDGSASRLRNCHVVFAAGPWNQSELDRLLPGNSTNLRFATNSANYLVVKAPEEIARAEQGKVNWKIEDQHLRLSFTARGDGTIMLSGLNETDVATPSAGGTVPPAGSSKSQYLDYARRILNFGVHDYEVVEWGRVFRPILESGSVVLAEIPRERLVPTATDAAGHGGGGKVYLGAGHGKHGMKLGMGSGKLLAQLVTGREPDISLELYGLPE